MKKVYISPLANYTGLDLTDILTASNGFGFAEKGAGDYVDFSDLIIGG